MLKFLFIFLFCSLPLFSAVVAIVDSGVDINHLKLSHSVFKNVNELKNEEDDDGNGYIDDVNGWNFLNDDQYVIDYNGLRDLTPDVFRFFELKAKDEKEDSALNEEEIDFIRFSIADPSLVEKIMLFGDFAHGTHVSGIVAKNSQKDVAILPIKLFSAEEGISIDSTKGLAASFFNGIKKSIEYAILFDARVVNCSFGVNYDAAESIVYNYYPSLRSSSDELKNKAIELIDDLNRMMGDLALSYPDVLFLIASGNDGANNNFVPSAPDGAKAPNVMSIAALNFKGNDLAEYSNFGEGRVDLAALGTSILSYIPGNLEASFSGTSMATPQVAAIANDIFEVDPSFNGESVKKIITMSIDYIKDLNGFLTYPGRVNHDRALVLSELIKKNGKISDLLILDSYESVPPVAIDNNSDKSDEQHSIILLRRPSIY